MNPRSVASVVAIAGLVGCSDTPAPAQKAPAPPPSVSRVVEIARLSGVGVTWLPQGFVAEPASLTPAAHSSSAWQDFRGVARNNPAPRLTLLVERGAPSGLNLATQEGLSPSHVTVRGHAGLLASLPAEGTPAFPAPTYYLQWVERPGLTVTIAATFGATGSDAQRMAAGLVVH